MTNILPPEIKKILEWQRMLRRVIVFMVVGLLGILLAFASIVPMYVYVHIIKLGVSDKLTYKDVDISTKRQEVSKRLNNAKKLVTTTYSMSKMPDTKILLDSIFDSMSKIKDIDIRSIHLVGDMEKYQYLIRVSGVSKSREGVVMARDLLRDDGFDIVDFPISNLTLRGGGYNFVIEVKAK